MVSVIVPIYNTERYLKKCLDSIEAQTYKDMEVILIDDGSSDLSGKICDSYAKNNSKIRAYHQENQGLIASRKRGIDLAHGEYIAFVDSDDWVEENFLQSMMEKMLNSKADIVISGGCITEKGVNANVICNKISPGEYDERNLEDKVYTQMLCCAQFFEFGVLPYLWNKLYKKELLAECYLQLDTTIYDGEDVAVLFPYLLRANKVAIYDGISYHYRIHPQSMTAMKKNNFYENACKLYLHLNQEFKQTKYYDILLPQLDQYMRMMMRVGNPDGFIKAEKQIFPFDKVPKGAKIVLYGAGHVGRLYYHQIQQLNYCEIVAWIDKGKAGSRLEDMPIKTVEELRGLEFECLVVALADRDIAAQVETMLVTEGIVKQKQLLV